MNVRREIQHVSSTKEKRRKLLVTGDRNWDDVETVVSILRNFPPQTILIHGHCRGADLTCSAVAEALGFEIRSYPADWTKHGTAAGPIRNRTMLNVEHLKGEPIDLCFAFHNDLASSKGTRNMIEIAAAAGIPVRHVTSKGTAP